MLVRRLRRRDEERMNTFDLQLPKKEVEELMYFLKPCGVKEIIQGRINVWVREEK